MKRRRQTLQVSTFPFLAVLLCTMGSLILILMVIDRRARIVALARLHTVVAQQTAEQAAAERARKEEWERARQALQETLESQLRELRGEKGAAENKVQHIVQEISIVEAARRALQGRLQAQRTELSQQDRELQQQGVEANSRTKLTESARAELLRLTADLDAMEKTLADLKALRQKKEQAFSLVPYRGKHGDNRKPIYVECTARGVVFHPGRFALDGYEVSPLAIRNEIDRRLARFQAAAPGRTKEQSAYVLMLLRPSGIRNYYQFVNALAGLKIDFGYELLEEGWELAFSDDDRQAAPMPWTGAPGSGNGVPDGTGTKPGGLWAGAGSGTGFGGAFQGAAPGSAPGNGGSAPGSSGTKNGSSWAGTGPGAGLGGGSPGSAPGSGVPKAVLGTPLGQSGNATGSTTSGGSHTGSGSPLNSGGSPGSRPGNPTGATSNNQTASAPTGGNPALPGDGRTTIASSQSPQVAGSGSTTGTSGSGGQPNGAQPLGNGNQPGSAGTAGQAGVSPGGSRPSTVGMAVGTANIAAAGAPGNEKPLSPLLTAPVQFTKPKTAGGSGSGISGQATRAGEGEGEGVPDEKPPADGQEPDKRRLPRDPFAPPPTGGGTSGPRNPLARPGAPEDVEKPARPLRVGSNRDWIILVECTADAVVLPGTGQRFDLAHLQLRAGNDNPLLQALRTLIARRQATVRPTEPEWKPQLRFLVHTDGLRAYYLAFPTLEPLRLPMTKQNREEKEE